MPTLHHPVPETKDGPELQAGILAMSVNPPRRDPLDAVEVDDPPPECSDSDDDEAPPPVELSESGSRILRAMGGYFAGLSAASKPGEAEHKLIQYSRRLLDKIKADSEPSEKVELLSRLGNYLKAVDESLQDTEAWRLVSNEVDRALEAASPAAVRFIKQTDRSLKTFAGYLDPANAFYNPQVFLGHTKTQLRILLANIQKHAIEGERINMLLQFAGALCVIAQSAHANLPQHADQRLQLVTFLATELAPVAGSTVATTQRSRQKMDALKRLLAPHQAELVARKQIVEAMLATFSQNEGRIDNCLELVRVIGASPLSASEKNACLAEMDMKFRSLVVTADQSGGLGPMVQMQYANALRRIHNRIVNSEDWPEPSAYKAVTDAVDKINLAEKASIKSIGK